MAEKFDSTADTPYLARDAKTVAADRDWETNLSPGILPFSFFS